MIRVCVCVRQDIEKKKSIIPFFQISVEKACVCMRVHFCVGQMP